MLRFSRWALSFPLLLSASAGAYLACSSSTNSSGSEDAGGSGGAGGDGGSPSPGDGSSNGDGPSLVTGDGNACENLECKIETCAGTTKTNLKGVVYDPAGNIPLYNVIVYVPNRALKPITLGASCETCSGVTSGNPLAVALTNSKGEFLLENIPTGDIPVVMQVGKWRRQVTIQGIKACSENAPADPKLFRLPRNQSEGDIPRFAIATGGSDPLECLLRKIGIDDSEFGTEGDTGKRIHLYAGGGFTPNGGTPVLATSKFSPSLHGGKDFAQAPSFWNDANKLKAYDAVLLACEGPGNDATRPESARQALAAYTNEGGRVFASHWQDTWFKVAPASFPPVADWTDITPPPPNPTLASLNTSFPKGLALRDWLSSQGVLQAGELPIKEAKHNVNSVMPDAGVQSWISVSNPNAGDASAVQYFTFNTPLLGDGGAQCGRVVYSDLHVSSGDTVGQPFPTGCTTTGLSPQERALEFMLFDLSSCVQKDTEPPQIPR